MNDPSQQKQILPLKDLFWLFLKFGFTGFGGPAVVIAMMEEDVVQDKKWLTREHFLDLVGATNLIPGPNSTEMAIHIGYITRGWIGLAIAGLCFIVPSILIALVFGVFYVALGSLPEMEILFFGIRPVVIAIIVGAVYRLGKKAAKGWQLLIIAAAVVPLVYFFSAYTVFILLGGGFIGMLWLQLEKTFRGRDEVIQTEKEEAPEFESNEAQSITEEVVITHHSSEMIKKSLIIS